MDSFYQQHRLPPLSHDEPYPLPNRMSIETSSKCNRRCPFCPISLGVRDHEQRFIDDALFTSIVEQIPSTVKCIEMFRLNEPLLDPRYCDRLNELRTARPRVTLYCATNGDVLFKSGNVERAARRMWDLQRAGLNVISIDVYDGDDGDDRIAFFDALVKELVAYRQFSVTDNRYQSHPTGRLYISVTDMRLNARRGLTSSWTNCGMHEITAPVRKCPRPMRHFVVLYDGTVPVCCVVNPGDTTIPRIGDLRHQSLVEIWNTKAMHQYRLHLQDGQRDLPGCDNCDAKVAYAFAVRRVK